MPIYELDGQAPDLPEPGRFWIAPDAHVIGRVRLGLDVGIWFGAVLRGDNEPIEVGERTNIQEGAMLHADPGFPLTIGPDVTVGHHAIVHGCTVGAGCLIGMGARVMDAVVIGAESIIAAGAVVTAGTQIPPRSLAAGVPAVIKKQLGDQDLAYIDRFWKNYIEYKDIYLNDVPHRT